MKLNNKNTLPKQNYFKITHEDTPTRLMMDNSSMNVESIKNSIDNEEPNPFDIKFIIDNNTTDNQSDIEEHNHEEHMIDKREDYYTSKHNDRIIEDNLPVDFESTMNVENLKYNNIIDDADQETIFDCDNNGKCKRNADKKQKIPIFTKNNDVKVFRGANYHDEDSIGSITSLTKKTVDEFPLECSKRNDTNYNKNTNLRKICHQRCSRIVNSDKDLKNCVTHRNNECNCREFCKDSLRYVDLYAENF